MSAMYRTVCSKDKIIYCAKHYDENYPRGISGILPNDIISGILTSGINVISLNEISGILTLEYKF